MEHPLGLKVPPELSAYFQAWLAKDAPALAACFTPDGEFRVPGQEEVLVGREAIQAFFHTFFQANDALELHRSRFFTAPGEVLSVSELTLELPMLGPGRFLISSAQVYELSPDGHIRRVRNFVDTAGAVRMAAN